MIIFKYKLNKFIFSFFYLFIIGCNLKQTNKIIEIGESSSCGDKGGRFHSTIIRQDFTTKISGGRINVKATDTLISKTDKNDWKKLISILNVKDFTKLKDGINGNMEADGCEEEFYIKTNDSIYFKKGLNFFKNINNSESLNDLLQ